MAACDTVETGPRSSQGTAPMSMPNTKSKALLDSCTVSVLKLASEHLFFFFFFLLESLVGVYVPYVGLAA